MQSSNFPALRLVLICVFFVGVTHSYAQSGPGAVQSPPQSSANTAATILPGYSKNHVGTVHDFDFLAGTWTTQQKRLKARDVGSTEWVESPGNKHCATAYLDGSALVETSWLPTGKPAGLFLYAFSPSTQQWSIYWLNPQTGQLDPPDVGGFSGNHGEFYSDDVDNGRPIKVRVVWTVLDQNHARWEQSFSYDDRTWEVNWVSDMTRQSATASCQAP
jgi:hypothetical protein